MSAPKIVGQPGETVAWCPLCGEIIFRYMDPMESVTNIGRHDTASRDHLRTHSRIRVWWWLVRQHKRGLYRTVFG